MKNKIIYLILGILLLNILSVTAIGFTSYTIVNSTNSSIAGSFTNETLYIGPSNMIQRYIKIPNNVTYISMSYFNLSVPSVSRYCYQESANTTNQTGIDGICSLNYSGKYSGTSWNSLGNKIAYIYDGDWGTNGAVISPDPAAQSFYVNYSKPAGATALTWKVGISNSSNQKINYSLSIPTDCFNAYTNKVDFRVNNTAGSYIFNFYCENGTNTWKNILSYNSGNGMYFREEAANWTVDLTNPAIIFGDNCDSYEYIGAFTNTTGYNTYSFGPEEVYLTSLHNQINNCLTECITVDDYCYLPINFTAANTGYLSYNKFYITNVGLNVNNITLDFDDHITNSKTFILDTSYDSALFDYTDLDFFSNITNQTSVLSSTKVYNTGSGNNGIYTLTLDLPNKSNVYDFYYVLSLLNTPNDYLLSSTYWNYTTFDFYKANLSDINIGYCNATNTVKLFNFTAYDQKTLAKISNWNFKATINYFLGNGTYFKILDMTNTSINEINICANESLNYKLTGQVEATKDGYNPTYYYFSNTLVNSQSNVSLYLLNISSAVTFILKVQDSNYLPLSNFYVYIYRYDTGIADPYLVQIAQTNNNGESLGFLEVQTVDYLFVIKDSYGNIVYTSSKSKIVPTTLPYTLTFTIGATFNSPISYYNNLTGLNYQITYNNNNQIVTYVYSDSNGTFSTSFLTIKLLNASGNNGVICNISSAVPTGSLICNLSGNLSGSYVAQAYVIRGTVTYLVDQLPFNIAGMSNVVGLFGVLAGFFIIMIACFLFAYNEVAGIISVNAAVIFVNLLGLVNFGYIVISAIIAVSIILLIILER